MHIFILKHFNLDTLIYKIRIGALINDQWSWYKQLYNWKNKLNKHIFIYDYFIELNFLCRLAISIDGKNEVYWFCVNTTATV